MFDFFSIVIYLILIVIIGFVVKAIFGIYDIKKTEYENFVDLLENFDAAKDKSKDIHEKLTLSESFYQSFFQRLFKINKELLLIQKLIFEKYP